VPALGAQSHFYSDLARPLFDQCVHKIGDAHSADEKGQAADHSQENLDAHENLTCNLGLFDGIPDPQGIVVFRVEAVFAAENLADASLHKLVVFGPFRLDVNAVDVKLSVDAGESGMGDVSVVGIEALIGRALELFLHNTDDRKGHSVDDNYPAHGIVRIKEVFGHVPADEGDPACGALVLFVYETAAAFCDHGAHDLEGGAYAANIPVRFAAPSGDGEVVVGLG